MRNDTRPPALRLVRISLLSAISGLMAGLASFIFLKVLDRITSTRVEHGWLMWLLPFVGFALGLLYHACDQRAAAGNVTIAEELRWPGEGVPFQLAPLSLVGTWLTHLFGGSGGREGTAIQMSAALTDSLARKLRLTSSERRLLLHAAIGGAFGAVFGVPFAGAIFGVEEPRRYGAGLRALVPTTIAAFVGHATVIGLGYQHARRAALYPEFSVSLFFKLIAAAVVFGITAGLYVRLLNGIRRICRWLRHPALATAIGGVWIVFFALLFGRQYLGLSVPLADRALAGAAVGGGVFAAKLLLTAITSGSGFRAGEVTPLFVIGATLGSALATPFGVDARLLAALGFVAVYGAAAKVPVASIVMGVELFGMRVAVPLAVVCYVARFASGRKSIYPQLKRTTS